MIDVVLSNNSKAPIYQQIFDQISAQIMRGDLKSDQGLPPIRTVARELRISIITVKKAWELLEKEKLIYSVVGRGCFVADLSKADLQSKRDDKVLEKLATDIAYYKEMGLSLKDILTAVEKVYNNIPGKAQNS
jgi:GntR family transcriptional regulator